MGRKPVTVSLPNDLVKETARFCRRRSITLSEMTRDAIRDYLHRQMMEEARRTFTDHLHQRGIFSEQVLLRHLRA